MNTDSFVLDVQLMDNSSLMANMPRMVAATLNIPTASNKTALKAQWMLGVYWREIKVRGLNQNQEE
jgi:hypothetical protein